MATIGVFDFPPRKYFDFDEDTEVEIEFISKDRMNKLIKKAEEAHRKLKTPQNLIYDMFLGKAAVHNWRHKDQEKNPGHPGFRLPGGSVLPFNGENRNMLMEKSSDFSNFVLRTCTSPALFLEEDPAAEDLQTLGDLLEDFDLEEEQTPKND